MRGGTGEETEWPVEINWGPGINYIYRLDIFFKISKMPPHLSSYFRKTPPSRFCPAISSLPLSWERKWDFWPKLTPSEIESNPQHCLQDKKRTFYLVELIAGLPGERPASMSREVDRVLAITYHSKHITIDKRPPTRELVPAFIMTAMGMRVYLSDLFWRPL